MQIFEDKLHGVAERWIRTWETWVQIPTWPWSSPRGLGPVTSFYVEVNTNHPFGGSNRLVSLPNRCLGLPSPASSSGCPLRGSVWASLPRLPWALPLNGHPLGEAGRRTGKLLFGWELTQTTELVPRAHLLTYVTGFLWGSPEERRAVHRTDNSA